MAALPYNNSAKSKKVQVEEMFDNISHRYDFLNHLLSLNIDKIWRRKAINKLKLFQPKSILDVATGTGDFAIAAAKIKGAKITSVDISTGMLKVGQSKIENKGLSNRIEMMHADSESLPFEDEIFDAAIVGFGVRNFEHLTLGLKEVLRVLKPGGVLLIDGPFNYRWFGDEAWPNKPKKKNRVYDYWRISKDGWEELTKDFSKVEITHSGPNIWDAYNFMVKAVK